jgi:three-Cys-motif partner protein
LAKRTRQMFGGRWTKQKLDRVEKYMQAYATALSKQSRFTKIFVDAFAGTGYSQMRRDGGATKLLFPALGTDESKEFIEGSTLRSLKVTPPFDKYIFIEIHRAKCQELEQLKAFHPKLADRISIKQVDANTAIQELCREWKATDRAVVFLDPFGMQVEWATLEAIAKTKAIDLWVLFPLGVGTNRLLVRDFKRMPKAWHGVLTRVFGTTEWKDAFYAANPAADMFDNTPVMEKIADLDRIGKFFVDRLKALFPKVVGPGLLLGPKGGALYLLVFAAANPGRGGEIAAKIARHLLKDL